MRVQENVVAVLEGCKKGCVAEACGTKASPLTARRDRCAWKKKCGLLTPFGLEITSTDRRSFAHKSRGHQTDGETVDQLMKPR